MKSFYIQVLCDCAYSESREWRSVRPTNGAPYSYSTREEAERVMRMCYPDESSEIVRVVEVPNVAAK